jgi:hypothetical protein
MDKHYNTVYYYLFMSTFSLIKRYIHFEIANKPYIIVPGIALCGRITYKKRIVNMLRILWSCDV